MPATAGRCYSSEIYISHDLHLHGDSSQALCSSMRRSPFSHHTKLLVFYTEGEHCRKCSGTLRCRITYVAAALGKQVLPVYIAHTSCREAKRNGGVKAAPSDL